MNLTEIAVELNHNPHLSKAYVAVTSIRRKKYVKVSMKKRNTHGFFLLFVKKSLRIMGS